MTDSLVLNDIILNDIYINPIFSEKALIQCFNQPFIEIYPRTYLVSDYELIKNILKDPTFTSREIGEGNYAKLFEILDIAKVELLGDVLFSDHLQHTKLREILLTSYHKLQGYIPTAIEQIVISYFKEFSDKTLSLIHLSTYISEKLFLVLSGVGNYNDYSKFDSFFTSIRLLLNGIDNNFAEDTDELLTRAWKFVFYTILEQINKHSSSTPSLLFYLADTSILSSEEKAIMILAFIRAGIENPRSYIVSAILRYFEHPEFYTTHKLQFLEEVLRFDCPAKITARYISKDTELSGFPLKQHSKVWLSFRIANFNDKIFQNPFEFKCRKPNPHLSLGFGPHLCIGKGLTYLLAQKIIDTIRSLNYDVETYADYRLDNSLVFRRYTTALYLKKRRMI